MELMPRYEHSCRECDLTWAEDYSIHDDPPDTCPECESNDVYRHVTSSGAVIFKGGGWSPQGYSKHTAWEKYGRGQVKLYDRKEDCDREMRGEAELAETRKLKHEDAAAKRILGPDAGVKQHEAEKRIKKAGQDAVEGPK
jgi:putative FmdB family regulatory protein